MKYLIKINIIAILLVLCFSESAAQYTDNIKLTKNKAAAITKDIAKQIALDYVKDTSAKITRIKREKVYYEAYISTNIAKYEIDIDYTTGKIQEVEIKFNKTTKVSETIKITKDVAQQIAMNYLKDASSKVTQLKQEKKYYEVYLSTNTANYEFDVDFVGNILNIEIKYF